MKGLLRWLLISSIFYLGGMQGNVEAFSYTPTILTKLFYHQGIVSDTVVCYFDKEPICNPLPHRESNQKAHEQHSEFFLPMTNLAGGQARTMMQNVNKTKRDDYSIQFAEVSTPVNGIKVSITYNPDKVYCDYATCDAISMQKGLVFSFHHKETLNLLKDNTDFVLRLVCNTTKTKPRVMLDFGHGGADDGKIGCNMVKEKDITMQVGNKVALLLRKQGYQVFLTRASDMFVPLDHRTTLANRYGADVFVSIHSNAGPASASGIETYWTGRAAMKHHVISKDNEVTLAMLCSKRDKANKQFADLIHQNIIKTVSEKHAVHDRELKESVAQVLLGTDMPSALVEMGFLSNRKETKYLTNSSYQLLLAQGICNGIEAYCKSLKIA